MSVTGEDRTRPSSWDELNDAVKAMEAALSRLQALAEREAAGT